MLIYKINVLSALKDVGYSTARLRKEKLLSESSIQYLRVGKPIGPVPLNTLCGLLHCQPGDILGYANE